MNYSVSSDRYHQFYLSTLGNSSEHLCYHIWQRMSSGRLSSSIGMIKECRLTFGLGTPIRSRISLTIMSFWVTFVFLFADEILTEAFSDAIFDWVIWLLGMLFWIFSRACALNVTISCFKPLAFLSFTCFWVRIFSFSYVDISLRGATFVWDVYELRDPLRPLLRDT